MAKPDLGDKRTCPECEKKFYDLTRNPALCPYCGNSFDPSELGMDTNTPDTESDVFEDADDEDEDDDIEENTEVDEDEEEADDEAKELELDGDDTALMQGGDMTDEDGEKPNFDGFSSPDDEDGIEEEEDADAALVPDDDDDTPEIESLADLEADDEDEDDED